MNERFIEQLRDLRLSQNRYAVPGAVTQMDVSESHVQCGMAREYRVEVRVGGRIIVTEDEIAQSNGRVLDLHAGVLRARIAHVVYGELRDVVTTMFGDLYSLKRASRNREDWDTVERVEKKLFALLDATKP